MPASRSTPRIVADNLEELVALALLLVVGASMTAQIVLRGAFGSPLGWPEILSQFLLVWASLLGAVGATKRASAVQIDAIVRRLPPPGRKAVEIVGVVAVAVLLVVLGWYGLQLTRRIRTIASPLPVTWAWAYAAAPAFSALMLLRLFQMHVLRHRFVHVEDVWGGGADATIVQARLGDAS